MDVAIRRRGGGLLDRVPGDRADNARGSEPAVRLKLHDGLPRGLVILVEIPSGVIESRHPEARQPLMQGLDVPAAIAAPEQVALGKELGRRAGQLGFRAVRRARGCAGGLLRVLKECAPGLVERVIGRQLRGQLHGGPRLGKIIGRSQRKSERVHGVDFGPVRSRVQSPRGVVEQLGGHG